MANKKIGRGLVYNNITSAEKLEQFHHTNKELRDDFLDYLKSIGRSSGTILTYRNNINIFFCWNLDFNNNKPFHKIRKREISRFQNHCIGVWGWSPKRVRTVKATLSSMSNFIADILDDEDEFDGFKPIINKIESPADVAVRDKSIFEEKELNRALNRLVKEGRIELACALSLAMNSGRRKAELCRFKVSYFNKDCQICNGALYKTPEKVKSKGRGTEGKMLYFYTYAKDFDPYLKLWLEKREELGIKSDWLFPKRDRHHHNKFTNEPVDTGRFNEWARQLGKILNKPFYWHCLRHYFATMLLDKGIPDDIVQDIIGWSSADMLRLYDDREASDKFDKFFGEEGIKEVKSVNIAEL